MMNIENGWVSDIAHKKSPNFSSGIHPLYIVIHYTASWEAGSAIRILRSPAAKVSAHFVLDLDGTLTQLVDLTRKAWHAGPSEYGGKKNINNYSIGIEIVNPGYLKHARDNIYIDAYDSEVDMTGKPLVKAANARVGSGPRWWPAYTPEQLATLDTLTEALVREYPTIADVVSHEEIDTRGWKTDPGPAFPMDRYKEIVKTGRKPLEKTPPANFPPPPEKIDVEDAPTGFIATLRKAFDKMFGK